MLHHLHSTFTHTSHRSILLQRDDNHHSDAIELYDYAMPFNLPTVCPLFATLTLML